MPLCTPAPFPGQVSVSARSRCPQGRGRGASAAPAGASGRRACAGLGSAGLSSAAGDGPAAAEAKTPFAKPSPGRSATGRRFLSPGESPPRGLLASRRGQGASGPAASRQPRRGSGSRCSSTAEQGRSGHLPPVRGGMGNGPLAACPLPPLPASQQIPSCYSKIKPESPKRRFPACRDSAEPSDPPHLPDRFRVKVLGKNDTWEVTQLTPELPQLSSKPSENVQFF